MMRSTRNFAVDDVEIVRLTYRDNCWCPQVMLDEAARDFEHDPIAASWTWDGLLRQMADELVFSGTWVVEDFDIEQVIRELKEGISIPYGGLLQDRRERQARQAAKINNAFFVGYDHGFVDPSTSIEIYLDEKNKRIFCLREMHERRQSLTQIPGRLKKAIPRVADRWPVSCDSARPDVISLLKDAGVNAMSCTKVKIKDRIDQLKTYLLVVAPGCENLIRELSAYRWQKDRNDNLLPTPVDEDNHLLDSIAYALGKILDVNAGEYKQLSNTWI